MPAGLLALLVTLFLLLLIPMLLVDAMLGALAELGITRGLAGLLVLGIFLGSLFNIPVMRRQRAEILEYRPFDFFGIDRMAPRLIDTRTQQVVALNVGGCVIPSLIVVYELLRLLLTAPGVLFPGLAIIVLNIAVCYQIARPVAGLGILLPAFIPGLVAGFSALLFCGSHAPAVAFCAGVLGPLVGADLLHLDSMRRKGAGLLSIGGAGSFDGIVISGFLATLLAA